MNADRLRPCDVGGRHFIVALAHHGHQPSRIITPQQLAGLA
jgi:hypothetical protein